MPFFLSTKLLNMFKKSGPEVHSSLNCTAPSNSNVLCFPPFDTYIRKVSASYVRITDRYFEACHCSVWSFVLELLGNQERCYLDFQMPVIHISKWSKLYQCILQLCLMSPFYPTYFILATYQVNEQHFFPSQAFIQLCCKFRLIPMSFSATPCPSFIQVIHRPFYSSQIKGIYYICSCCLIGSKDTIRC